MVQGFNLTMGGAELLDDVAGLWEQQRVHHVQVSTHFRRRLQEGSFAERRIAIETAGKVGVALAQIDQVDRYIGYCIGSINREGNGIVQSLFVEAQYRGYGVGTALLESVVRWMDNHDVKRKSTYVASGNERVFSLYERFGFMPKSTILEQVSDSATDKSHSR